jgi:hypothetical protein
MRRSSEKDNNIGPFVNLFFQEPGSLGITGGEVTLTERMFMVGIRRPFPKIVWEICTFLGVIPSQIAPNGWRYVVASSILWHQVLGTEMDAAQFFSVYRPSIKDGAVELRVRQDPIFIYHDQRKYGNNKGWRQQIFRVSGEWECPAGSTLPDEQKVPRDWRPLVDDLRILPRLSVSKIKEVNEMLSFSVWSVWASIDFENLVSMQSLNDCFGYQLLENKMALDNRGFPIPGWTLTTGRPIPGNAPKKSARKGTLQGSVSKWLSELSSRKTKASRILGRSTTTLPSSETAQDAQDEESSGDSDNTIMREIDESMLALSKEGNEESSSAVIILPSGPDRGAFLHARSPQSPPPSFEDFVEEEVIATLAEGVKDPPTSRLPLESLPTSKQSLSPRSETVPPKRKGKEVALGEGEVPIHKKLRADRDSNSMSTVF